MPSGGMNEAGLDFSLHMPVKVISINTPHKGVLNPYFFEYDGDLNKWLVFYSIRHTPQTKDLPDELLEAFARYPEVALSQKASLQRR